MIAVKAREEEYLFTKISRWKDRAIGVPTWITCLGNKARASLLESFRPGINSSRYLVVFLLLFTRFRPGMTTSRDDFIPVLSTGMKRWNGMSSRGRGKKCQVNGLPGMKVPCVNSVGETWARWNQLRRDDFRPGIPGWKNSCKTKILSSWGEIRLGSRVNGPSETTRKVFCKGPIKWWISVRGEISARLGADYMASFSPPTGLKFCCDYMTSFSPGWNLKLRGKVRACSSWLFSPGWNFDAPDNMRFFWIRARAEISSPVSKTRLKISARAEIRHVIGSLAGLSFHLGLLDRERLSARAELRNAGFFSEHEFKTHSTTQWTRMVCKRYKKKSCYNNCGRIGYHK